MGVFGVIADSTAQAKLGLHLSPIVWIALTLTVVTVMSYRGVDVSLRVMGILVSLEVVALLVMDIAILVSGGDAGVSLDGFQLSAIASPGFGLAFLFIVTNFTGFEATVVFSEEARDPRRTIPRAAYTAIAVIGLFYALTVWALSIGWGPANVQAAAAQDPQTSSSSWLTTLSARGCVP